MALSRKAFVDADFWINLSRVGSLDLLFELYPEIYLAREVAIEITNFHDAPEPYDQYGKKLKTGKVKVIDLDERNFSALTVQLLQKQRDEYEHRVGFIVKGTKNLGEFASVQYAHELDIQILMSDDKQAKPILENEFEIIIRDHCDLIIEAEELQILKSSEAIAIYNKIEKLKAKPSDCNYTLMKRIRQQ